MQLWEAFLRLLYPSRCATCGRVLELEEQGLCAPCSENLQKLSFFPSEERIRLSLLFGEEGWALFRYEEAVKEILHKIKFERRRDLLRLFAPAMAGFLKRRPHLSSYDCLIPIPLDRRRQTEREFNQSGLLAQKLYELLREKEGPLPRLLKRALLKNRFTLPQSFLGREARRLNLERAFCVSHSRRIRGQSILLVDDIFTTGATVDEAAKTLKAAGAARVGYLALARALPN